MLPEKWSIKITKENMPIIGAYYNKKTNSSTYTSGVENRYIKSHNINKENIIEVQHTSSQSFLIRSSELEKVLKEYPEITLEQFKQLVLNQSLVNEQVYEIY